MLIPSKLMRQQLGGIAPGTEWRWWQAGMPRPLKINGRNYYTQEQREVLIPAWLEATNERRPD